MSEMEYHSGKIRPLDLEGVYTPKEFIYQFTVVKGYDVDPDDFEEALEVFQEFSDKYIYSRKLDKIFKIEDTEHPDEDIYHTRQGDVVHYGGSFYNGGTCISEILEEIIDEAYSADI